MNRKDIFLLVGTSKGLVVYKRRDKEWIYSEVHFLGFPVSQVYVHPFTDMWWVALSHRHWGPKLHCSKDCGTSWENISSPVYPSDAMLKNNQPASIRTIWAISHGGEDNPDDLYLGTEPGGLFYSSNRGKDFELVKGLWDHPSRKKEWFGAGGTHFPGIHSIIVDPRDNDHILVGISIAGVFASYDKGKNWQAQNEGLRADYLPNPIVKVGHDPHRMIQCHAHPDIIWQQNHCGVYKSTNTGKSWIEVSEELGKVYYGFALAVDPGDADKAWVIPAQSDELRVATNLQLSVSRTEDGGGSWATLNQGLPQSACFDIVFRHALAIMGPTLAFGTTTGNLFLSEDEGDSWKCLNHFLPRIHVVCFA